MKRQFISLAVLGMTLGVAPFKMQVKETLKAKAEAETFAYEGMTFEVDSINPDFVILNNSNNYQGEELVLNTVFYNAKEYLVNNVSDTAFSLNNTIKKLVMNNATTVPNNFFENFKVLEEVQCNSLASINSPLNCSTLKKASFNNLTEMPDEFLKDNTSIEYISLNALTTFSIDAFNGCTNLKDVICPSAIVLGKRAFKNTSSLKSFISPTVENIGASCFENSGVEIVICDTANVMGSCAFKNAVNLKTISFKKMPSIADESFSGCTSLEEVIIDTNIVSTSSFSGCTNLKHIVFPRTGAFMSNVFYGCDSLEDVTLLFKEMYNWDSTFAGANNLKCVFCVGATSISESIFLDCVAEYVYFGNKNIAVTKTTLSNLTKLKKVFVQKGLKDVYKGIESSLIDDCGYLINNPEGLIVSNINASDTKLSFNISNSSNKHYFLKSTGITTQQSKIYPISDYYEIKLEDDFTYITFIEHEVVDANFDHHCDVCGLSISNHNDGNKDLKCDYCGNYLEEGVNSLKEEINSLIIEVDELKENVSNLNNDSSVLISDKDKATTLAIIFGSLFGVSFCGLLSLVIVFKRKH